jgi:hypothetical protein
LSITGTAAARVGLRAAATSLVAPLLLRDRAGLLLTVRPSLAVVAAGPTRLRAPVGCVISGFTEPELPPQESSLFDVVGQLLANPFDSRDRVRI